MGTECDTMATMTPRELMDEILANVTPAGRFQAVIDMLNDGRITPSQASELFEMPEMMRVIGVDFGSEPSTAVIFYKCGRCEQVLDFGDADPTEIAIMKRGHDMICPARNGVVNGMFHIEPDPPDLRERQAAKVAERQREERDSLLSKSWESMMLDEYYPRDENGRHYIPASPKVDWSRLTKTRKSDTSRKWVEPVQFAEPGAGTFDYAAAFRGIDRSESPERLSGAKNHRIAKVEHRRPDGFAQPQIDEIKAMLTAPVKGKR